MSHLVSKDFFFFLSFEFASARRKELEMMFQVSNVENKKAFPFKLFMIHHYVLDSI